MHDIDPSEFIRLPLDRQERLLRALSAERSAWREAPWTAIVVAVLAALIAVGLLVILG